MTTRLEKCILEGGSGLKKLLKARADPNASNANGFCPLHRACDPECYDYKAAQLLIEAQADVNISGGPDKRTPLHKLFYNSVGKQCPRELLTLLLQHKADVNARSGEFTAQQGTWHQTPLHLAARNQNYEAVKLLLEAKADHSLQTAGGLTALQITGKGCTGGQVNKEIIYLLSQQEQRLQVDSRVILAGLTSDAGILLNGHCGKITGLETAEGRFPVQMGAAPPKAISSAKLRNLFCYQARPLRELDYAIRSSKSSFAHKLLTRDLKFLPETSPAQRVIGKRLATYDIEALLTSIHSCLSPSGEFGETEHLMLFPMSVDPGAEDSEVKGAPLPDNAGLFIGWVDRLCQDQGVFHGKMEHVVYPQENERFLFRSERYDRHFSVRYHVLGRDIENGGPVLNLIHRKNRQGFGDVLAVALTGSQEELWKGSGWCNESIVVFAELELLTCAACGHSASSACKTCRRIVYCSRECQTKDWPRHKKICSARQKISTPAVTPELQLLADKIKGCNEKFRALVVEKSWSALAEYISTLGGDVVNEVRFAFLTSEAINTVIMSVAESRDDDEASLCLHALAKCLRTDAMLWSMVKNTTERSSLNIISKHTCIFVGLMRHLIRDPFSDHAFLVWTFMNNLTVHGSHVSKRWSDAGLAEFIAESLRNLVINFDTLKDQQNQRWDGLSWLAPAAIWGTVCSNPQLTRLLNNNRVLLSDDVIDSLDCLFNLISQCHLGSVFRSLCSIFSKSQRTNSNLPASCFDESGHFWFAMETCFKTLGKLSQRLRPNLRANPLISEFYESYGEEFCNPPMLYCTDIDSGPGLLMMNEDSGIRCCMQCERACDVVLLCSSCQCVPYCSHDCRLKHWRLHWLLCSARD